MTAAIAMIAMLAIPAQAEEEAEAQPVPYEFGWNDNLDFRFQNLANAITNIVSINSIVDPLTVEDDRFAIKFRNPIGIDGMGRLTMTGSQFANFVVGLDANKLQAIANSLTNALMPHFKGERGIPGARGLPGKTGRQGERGEKGEQGERGEQGVSGARGRPGKASTIPGPQGEKGEQGERGLPGAPGAFRTEQFKKPITRGSIRYQPTDRTSTEIGIIVKLQASGLSKALTFWFEGIAAVQKKTSIAGATITITHSNNEEDNFTVSLSGAGTITVYEIHL